MSRPFLSPDVWSGVSDREIGSRSILRGAFLRCSTWILVKSENQIQERKEAKETKKMFSTLHGV